ncbi:putative membrane protein [Frankia sp. AiPs1]|uniref:GlsB/YeaQ/YmgE family stress response membrane protein n=1 Tax=Frankia sp. AiPa1 TaxID=573492 RepID=UPI00202B1C84|nr:GlsB/YeaQ/YmgE family stress response membrane protein [Frankia sp. AiPa1]MCL9758208.1 GlsB/YeaQ/YmgE family stress response membrane protein [Frankia sp. AiPa1]
MVTFIVVMILLGLVAGAVARVVLPGPDPIGILGTIIVGVIGSFVGGFLGYVLFNKDVGEGALQPAGIIGSIIGAIIVLLIWRNVGTGHSRSRGRSRRYARR